MNDFLLKIFDPTKNAYPEATATSDVEFEPHRGRSLGGGSQATGRPKLIERSRNGFTTEVCDRIPKMKAPRKAGGCCWDFRLEPQLPPASVIFLMIFQRLPRRWTGNVFTPDLHSNPFDGLHPEAKLVAFTMASDPPSS